MGTKVPGYERSRNESSGERKGPGTKVLHRDLSFLGTKGLGYEKSVIRTKWCSLLEILIMHFDVVCLQISSVCTVCGTVKRFRYFVATEPSRVSVAGSAKDIRWRGRRRWRGQDLLYALEAGDAVQSSVLSLISSAPAKMNYPIMHLQHNS